MTEQKNETKTKKITRSYRESVTRETFVQYQLQLKHDKWWVGSINIEKNNKIYGE